MLASTLETIEDNSLKQVLLNKDYIPVLETLLEKEGQSLSRLKKLKKSGKLDYGPKISGDNLVEPLSGVKKEVDRILGTEGTESPLYRDYNILEPGLQYTELMLIAFGAELGSSISFAVDGDLYSFMGKSCFIAPSILLYTMAHIFDRKGHYYPDRETMLVKKDKKALLIPTIGHEYDHHVFNVNEVVPNEMRGKSNIFEEGHARGVQRHISEYYRENEDNEAFLYDITEMTENELKQTYKWVCKKLKVKPSDNLLKGDVTSPDKHALGNSLFYTLETVKGDGVYRDAINGKIDFAI